jgi:hypothetical protein
VATRVGASAVHANRPAAMQVRLRHPLITTSIAGAIGARPLVFTTSPL